MFGLVIAPVGWMTPTRGSLGLFIAAGAISAAALLCVNRSLKLAPASIVVPYQYTMIVWAVGFGYIVFGDVPQLSTAVGAAVIVGAGLYIFLRERELGRSEAVVNPPA
jgi:drug/metabolite transporter (DMT)-like permease